MTIARMVTLMLLTGFAMWSSFVVGVYKAFAGDTWITASVKAYHFDRSKSYNEVNQGVGLEVSLADDWRAAGGAFRNSFSKVSSYAGFVYAPFRIAGAQLGFMGGGVTGYDQKVSLAIVPTLMIEGRTLGVNLLVMPKHGSQDGGLGLQGKIRW